jgi:hypothetical protein|tara:strand:+ start:1305 stop:1430 length:126 start_codon:yes stop_codon:yes gene_type:complete
MSFEDIKSEIFSDNRVVDVVDYQDIRDMPNEVDIRWEPVVE